MNKGTPLRQSDLGDLLQNEVYPALFSCLDSAFPEFQWKRTGNHWTATSWPPGFPFPVEHENPERLMVYQDRPYWIKIHGHEGVRFLDYVNGGQSPTGPDFPKAVKDLCERCGVRFPEREYSPEELEREAKKERRRSALDAVIGYCQEALWSKRGTAALAYLKERGLTEEGIKTLEIGFYTSVSDVSSYLQKNGVDATDTALLWNKLEGYIIFPWADANGQPLTLYGRWPGKPPKDLPKTIALPGEGTKASPLYFDRTRQAHQKDLILVEGVLDAAVLHDKGDPRVMACVAAQLSGLQVETLQRYRVSSVTICLDPDGGGERGTLSCIKSLHEAGIKAYVAPTLPDGMDPDQFVLKHGMDAWKAHINQRIAALRYQAQALVRKHKTGKEWTDAGRVAALDEAITYDAGITSPETLMETNLFFWPVIKDETGANEEDIEARRVSARERQKQEKDRIEYDSLLRTSHELIQKGETEKAKELLRDQVDRLRAEERISKAEPIVSVVDELEAHAQALEKWRDKRFIGLCQKTLPSLDNATLGFRGLMLLAAGPNVGKTSLSVQFGLDIVEKNPDACFLFLSLEMTRMEIMTRMKCRLAEVDWPSFVFQRNVDPQRLKYGTLRLKDIGERIRILDERNFPFPTLEKVVRQVEDLKARTGTSRAFVLVDYLQVWPIPPSESKNLRNDLDADKWRIGTMKNLRDELAGDAVMVISEARKPKDGEDEWGGELSSVMGSARGTYTPDMVFLLNPLSDSSLKETAAAVSLNGGSGPEIRETLEKRGISWNRLKIAKGRDGVHRGFKLDLTFWFTESRFEEGFQKAQRTDIPSVDDL